MSHNISVNERLESLGYTNGGEAIYGGGKAGWHGFGKTVDHLLTGDDICAEPWFFDVEKIQQLIPYKGEMVKSDQWAVIRMDTGAPLGYVGEDYSVWQNRDAVTFIDGLLKDGIMKYDACFSMMGGKYVTMSARMPQCDFMVEEGDKQLCNVIANWGHGGNGRINLFPCSFRPECWNMTQVAIGEAKEGNRLVSFKHTKNMGKYLEMAADYISQFSAAFSRYNAQAAAMVKRQYTPQQVHDYIQQLFPVKGGLTERQLNNIEKDKATFMQCLATENKLRSVQGTVWALYNAATRFIDWNQDYKGGKIERQDNRWKNITEGNGAEFKAKALELAVSLA